MWIKAKNRLPGVESWVKWKLNETETDLKSVTYIVKSYAPSLLSELEWFDADMDEQSGDSQTAERKDWEEKRISELSLLVHRLCKQIEDNFIEGKPLDIKKAEEARNYIIRNFSGKDILRRNQGK
jgi:hypothetical protein